jgi:parallel beta-helix repeat protein
MILRTLGVADPRRQEAEQLSIIQQWRGTVGCAKRKALPILTALLLVLSVALVVTVVPIMGAAPLPVFYVAPTGSDSAGNGTISSPFATISHAVAGATSGSTVIVEPGIYREMVLVTTQITLVSQSSQPSTTIVDATGKPVGIVVQGSGAAGTVIQGFTVENAENEGIYVQDSSNVIVENNVVNHNGLNVIKGLGEIKGIQLTGTSDSTVAGNTVADNLYGGIGVTDDGPINPSWNSTAAPGAGIPAGSANPGNGNTISGNIVARNRPNHCAIVVSAYNQGEGVANNIVSNNLVVDNQNGVIVAADTPNTSATNNTIISNNILNNGEGGVIIHSNAPGDVVTGNAIINNVFNANGYAPGLVGIVMGGEGPVAVQSTTITGNTFQNEVTGIQIVNAKQTLVGGNVMEATVQLPVNGTVTIINVPSATAVTSTGIASLALPTAIGTLIVGLIAGMIVSPFHKRRETV